MFSRILNSKALRIVIVIVVIAGVFGLGYFAKGWEDDKKIKAVGSDATSVVDQLREGKVSEIYNRTTPEFQQYVSEEDFAKSVALIKDEQLSAGEVKDFYKGIGQYLVQYELVSETKDSQGVLTIVLTDSSDSKVNISDIYLN